MAEGKKGMDPKVAAALGVAAGLAVGVAAGALTDPKKREKLGKMAKEAKSKAAATLKSLGDKAEVMRGELKEKADDVKEAVRSEKK